MLISLRWLYVWKSCCLNTALVPANNVAIYCAMRFVLLANECTLLMVVSCGWNAKSRDVKYLMSAPLFKLIGTKYLLPNHKHPHLSLRALLAVHIQNLKASGLDEHTCA